MTLAAAHLDSLGAVLGAVLILGWMGFVLVLARVMGNNERRAREQRAAMLEVDHPMSSVADFAAYRDAKVQRARFRHVTRHGRSA